MMTSTNASDSTPALLDLLKHIKRQPGMWIGGQNPDALRHFLNGLYLGLRMCGGTGGFDEFYWQAATARGWEYSSAPAEHWMKTRGMSDEAIIGEMLDIEIDACIQRTRDSSEESLA